jgi:hypothetical protein
VRIVIRGDRGFCREPIMAWCENNGVDFILGLAVVLDVPRVKGTPGRPKELPDDLYADRGYDGEGARTLLRWLESEPHIAMRRTEHSSGPRKVRWVVERTIGWLKGCGGCGCGTTGWG